MKNKLINIIRIIIVYIFSMVFAYSFESFVFDVTKIEITQNGEIFKGKERGIIKTNDGLDIEANNFEYNKISNILISTGNVKIFDKINNLELTADKITYEKNRELIFSNGNTDALIQSDFKFHSSNIIFYRDKKELSSNYATKVIEKDLRLYNLENFKYYLKKKILYGKNIYVVENHKKKSFETDQLFFSDGFFELENKNFVAGKTILELKKNIFANPENDPRITGISSKKKDNLTIINKAIFTSCKKNDSCPPWSIQAKKITHDNDKQQLLYDNAILRLYDFPILYFPKFFHPDPSVKRQSGFLKPTFNESTILGSSIIIPYFKALSKNKDLTIKPAFFDSNINLFNIEYRQQNKNSYLESDFALINGFKSSVSQNKNNISHFFSKFNKNLNLKKFNKSDLNINVEKVTNDTYLKIFDNILYDTPLKPTNFDTLKSEINLYLDNNKSNFFVSFSAFENLTGKNSDRYQFVLPYINYNTKLLNNKFGNLNFNLNGNNNLTDTNNLKSNLTNNLNFSATEKIFYKYGLKTNLNFYLKNSNYVGKKNNLYESKLNSDIKNLYIFDASLPLNKIKNDYIQMITPKISLRTNPGSMVDHSSVDRYLDAKNIFSPNRLSLDDSFETGNSLTIGLDYVNKNLSNENKLFETNLAMVFRDKIEKKIPSNSSINKKNSNLFGNINFKTEDFYNIGYNFSLDNKLEKFERHSFSGDIKLRKFVTGFNFLKENGSTGNVSFLENKFTYELDNNNFLSFKTRRNRSINLTEFYDLIYEYKNDCLTAGVKYKKTFYDDRELKPTEDLFFSITIFPLTTYEKKINDLYQ